MQITLSLAQKPYLSSSGTNNLHFNKNSMFFLHQKYTRAVVSTLAALSAYLGELLKSQCLSRIPNQQNHKQRWDAGVSIFSSDPDESMKLQWMKSPALEKRCSIAVVPETIRIFVASFLN